MSVNGVTSATNAYTTPQTTAAAATKEKVSANAKAEDTGVVYEASTTAKDGKSDKITDYSSIVANMKKELSSKNQQLQNLVNQLLGKQAGKYTKLADLFKNINADPATIEQAKKDIGEDGYWGVNQTSDRLVSMAIALTGGDTDKADEMMSAIEKGYKQATEAWGEDLPQICQDTLDATRQKMQDWKNGVTTAEDYATYLS